MKSTKATIHSARRRHWSFISPHRCLGLLVALLSVPLLAQEWAPGEQFLDLVRKIESADGLMLIGDQGNSRGAYQMSEGAWKDVSAWRRSRSLRSSDYLTSVWNETVSRAYAANYLQMLHERLARSIGRIPSCGEVYAAYNMGFTAFAHCQFSLAHVNPTTAGNCRFIDRSIGHPEPAKGQESAVALAVK
jgi:hypothetical protein